MKKITLLVVLFFLNITIAQPPAGYYNSASGTGYTLKTQLKNIINNNTNSLGTANYGDLWDLFTTTPFRDNYYENNGSLLDLYSEKPSGTDSYEYTSTSQQCGNYSAEGDCYNREHIMPQSVFNSQYPMYSDAHFVLPSDGSVNGARGNLPFGIVGTANYTSTNSSKRGNNTNTGYTAGYSGVVFEPINEFKGDVARAMLYFATRYETEIPSWSYDMFNGTSTQVYTNTFLNIMIKWHLLDPVSPYETAKNNAVYNFQGNRNPFIDQPNYVCQIWPTQCAALSLPEFETYTVEVYPNPTKDQTVTIESSVKIENISVFSINGQLINVTQNFETNNQVKLENLASGFYILQINIGNQMIYKKLVVE